MTQRVAGFLGVLLSIPLQAAMAAELIQPPICSAATAGRLELKDICTVKPLGNGGNEVKIYLTAETATIDVGGYKVTTENYNRNYLTPVVEAMPGDTVAARLSNILTPRSHAVGHGHGDDNPTNLHYFHGGIVTPNNARPKPAELGDGDNVYVLLKAGKNVQGVPNSFEFKVPIPGAEKLDARVLEGTGFIAHPQGLNWYHSHLHGISSDQVMGGMSGLLSTGEATANVKAACRQNPKDPAKCLNDVSKDTVDLRRATKVRYALLRDLPLRGISKQPEEAIDATARWAPEDKDTPDGTKCGVWKQDDSGLDIDNVRLRKGFCQFAKDSAWLFTLNGQRFPTITVEGGRNLLLRLGNLSANIPFWLELQNEADEKDTLPLTILSLDGVVPARPVPPEQEEKPVQKVDYNDILLMPATRAEIYVRNDEKPHATAKVYILRTRGFKLDPDEWPAIELARIVLEPNVAASNVVVALNAPVARMPVTFAAKAFVPKTIAQMPVGCVRDLDPAHREYRRVTFIDGGVTSAGVPTEWSILTEIIRPSGNVLMDEGEFKSHDPDDSTVGMKKKGEDFYSGIPFEEYVQEDGLVDWTTKKHVCVLIDDGDHAGSHKQLWVLSNATSRLHNFHIHQMKFRLATATELAQRSIQKPEPSSTCGSAQGPCDQPDIKFYDDQGSPNLSDPGAMPVWHDTIPIPPTSKVYIIMSFDAPEQVGRFVFHCHILKHEDKGLMAPIEVWTPTAKVLQ